MSKTDTVWIEVAIKRRSKFDDGWQVESTEDGTVAWVNDGAIKDSDDSLDVGVITRIELDTGYAEDKGLA